MAMIESSVTWSSSSPASCSRRNLIVRLVVVQRANDVIAILPGVGLQCRRARSYWSRRSAPGRANAAPNVRRSGATPEARRSVAPRHPGDSSCRNVSSCSLRGRQSGDVVVGPAGQRPFVGDWGGGQFGRFQLAARMNASIGLRTHAVSFTAGGTWGLGGTNAQCCSHLAPCAIQARSDSISSGVSGLPSGGIRSDSSSAETRASSRLSSGRPGTMASPARFQLGERRLRFVEPQAAVFGVGAVAGKAAPRENWFHGRGEA